MNLIQEDEWVKMTFAPNFYADKKLKMFSLLFDFKKDFSEDFRISIQPLKKIKKKNKSAIITLTFDDGTKDHLKVASYLHKNGLKGTFFIIPKYRDRVEFLNLKELNEIHKLKMELAYHHYNPITDMYFQNLGKNLKDDFLETKKILPSIKPHFAYPLGKFDLYGRYEFIKNNFKSGRIVGGGPETIPPGNKYLLRSVNITSQTKVEELIAIVKNCIKSQTWGIFMFHKLKEENPEGLVEYSMSDFKKFVEFLKNEKINVKTIGEVISNLK
ncbi:MAG: polysaccharide deacetylase family protein [Halobacteriovoraceae bacterium]|nr:polysaccharide deacetylase family protein [Halobacteriovoraceae bacterium]